MRRQNDAGAGHSESEINLYRNNIKDPSKGGKDCRQLVTDEIGYYTGKGYFPEGCCDAEKGTVCFCRARQKAGHVKGEN